MLISYSGCPDVISLQVERLPIMAVPETYASLRDIGIIGGACGRVGI